MRMDSTDDQVIERELREAQGAVIAAREATRRRQKAVTAARAAGWSKYRIAEILDVKAPTVDSILKAAARDDDQVSD
jgi:DNA-directed RNA polymerase specialized sigma24 family protein